METIRITALRHSAFYSPLLVTMGQGYLRDEGLEVYYQPAQPGESVQELLGSGAFHVSQSAVSTSFADLDAGKSCEVVHFSQINERDGFFVTGRDADASFNWEKLRGKTVLVDHFFQPLAMLRYGLHRQGIGFDELRIVDAGEPGNMLQAFRDGTGAYVHLQGPVPQELELEGKAYVLAAVGDMVGKVAFSSLCATRAWLKSGMASAFMRAYRKGMQFVLEQSPGDVARAIQPYLHDTRLEALTVTVRAYQQLGCWTRDVNISTEAYNNLLNVFEHSGDITRRHPMDSCVVPAPL